MGFLNRITAFLPFAKKEEKIEYFFALSITPENLTAALWAIEGKSLNILSTASSGYASQENIVGVTDKLLDQVIGIKEIEPQKILFGIPYSWLLDDNLKDEYLKLLRGLVKELELTPMAYVATSSALLNFLEKEEGVPTTAILVGFEKLHLTVTVVRAGKLDGVKEILRGQTAGSDIEKALLTFVDVETLPSRILIYGNKAESLKSQLLSFPWMNKLSFLHLPKIEVLDENVETKSVCLAGGSEMESDIKLVDQPVRKETERVNILPEEKITEPAKSEPEEGDNFGFAVGDVAGKKELVVPEESPLEIEDFENEVPPEAPKEKPKSKLKFKGIIPLLAGAVVLGLIVTAYVFLVRADIKIFVEPEILEKDAQVVADPNQKQVDEEAKIIPGQTIEVEVSGAAKETTSGKKQIGDPARGTVIIYNKVFDSLNLSKGTQIVNKSGVKFTLDSGITIASSSASDSGITFGKTNVAVTAQVIGADGNLPSGSELTVAGHSSEKVTGKAEGNFSGGTSRDVTVVSSDDQGRLLAKLSSQLKQEAQQKLQEKYPNKKVLQEALSEEIVKKSYSKNINDVANEFSLNLSAKYKGTAFDDGDLRLIVSKLVDTQVPEGFTLDLNQTETQADVAKLEKNGKVVFLARFKAKLMPKIDSEKIKNQIRLKTLKEAEDIIKSTDHILGSEIKLNPNLPSFLARLPILAGNIKIEVGLK